MSLKTLILLTITAKLTNTTPVYPCQTPNYKNGECVPIGECQYLNGMYRNGTRNMNQANYLTSAICGYVGEDPKVCCHLRSYETLNVTSDVVFVESTLLPDIDECGFSVTDKICGGNVTALDEFPWMAVLQYKDADGVGIFNCGGFLINDRYVITAAHCVNSSLFAVRLGEHDLRNSGKDCMNDYCVPPAIDVSIERKIIFKNYSDIRSSLCSYHDIALLRLSKKVEYSETIRPICLPKTTNEIFSSHTGEYLPVSGWGLTETLHPSHLKLKVFVPVGPCRKYETCDSSHMCAGGEKGKDSCTGDSGGPLMYRKRVFKNGRVEVNWYALGVIGGGRSCGLSNELAAHAKVSKYMYWITQNLKP